jgi:hypothetical protein
MSSLITLNTQSEFEDYMDANRDWFYRRTLKMVKNAIELGLESFIIVVFKFRDDEETEYELSLEYQDYSLNLSYALAYFEEIEEYETCEEINKVLSIL